MQEHVTQSNKRKTKWKWSVIIGKKKPGKNQSGIAKVMGSNPVEALIFSRLLLSNCLNWKIYCDDHTSLSSTTAVQNMNYFIYIFHMFHCTGRYELNKLTLLPMCGFIAQLVEHRTGIAKVMGSNPVEALIFSRLLLSNCLNWKIYCDDHTSLSSTTAVQNMNYFIYIFHMFHCTGRYELNKLTLLPMCGFIAQLVEHRTGIAKVMGSNPVEALIFSRLLLSNCLNWKIYCDDHTSLSSTTAVQNMNYFIYIFHMFHCTGRYELNKLTLLPMCGFIAQLVEHRTGIAKVMGSNPVEALIFSRLLLSNCLNWKIYCDDHTSLSSTTAVQNMNYFIYIFHKRKTSWVHAYHLFIEHRTYTFSLEEGLALKKERWWKELKRDRRYK